jgi:hypothetical protein
LGRRAASGNVPAREGVLRLMDETRAAGLALGVCSAATRSSAVAVVENLLGRERYEARPPLPQHPPLAPPRERLAAFLSPCRGGAAREVASSPAARLDDGLEGGRRGARRAAP